MDDAEDAHTRRLMYKAYMTPSARKSDKVRRYSVRFLFAYTKTTENRIHNIFRCGFARDFSECIIGI